MGESYKYMYLIVSAIAIVAIVKIIQYIYKMKRGERGAYPPPQPCLVNSGNQLSGSLNEFGPVNYYANTKSNQKDRWFQFIYRKVNGEWLTYILRMPSLNGRSGNLHLTHRYKNKDTYWICYDPQPRTLKAAQIVSRAWADRELEYISTGVPFEEQEW